MNKDERRLRDMWLAELWPTCREVSREDRDAERALAESRSQAVKKAGDKRVDGAA